jgi:glycosyltransferase involved in cell wall biosynthesis
MTVPAVSICIPAYARPAELRRAIQSVLTQGVDAVEVVVGDDSGDLEPVISEFDDDRIRYFCNPVQLGMAGNWTAVLDKSSAPLAGLLMDDDRLLPGFLPAVLERFAVDSDLGVVFTDHLFDDGFRNWPRVCRLAGGHYERFLVPLLRYSPVPVSASVMRRAVWEAIRPLPDLLTADVVMHLRAAVAGFAFYYVAEPLMAYAVHPGQLSNSSECFRHDQVTALDMFRFDDPGAERLRRHCLSTALVSAAAADLLQARVAEAGEELARARRLAPLAFGVRGAGLSLLTSCPRLLPLAVRARARLKQV